jgi:hypothetical protein
LIPTISASTIHGVADTESLVGLLLFLLSFLAWWYQTIPVYRERARARAAQRRWRDRLKSLPSAVDYQTEFRAAGTYTPRPFTGDRFPGSVPSTYTSSLGDAEADETNFGMPTFAPVPHRATPV